MPNVLSQFPDLTELLAQRDLLSGRISGIIDLLPEDSVQIVGSLVEGMNKTRGVIPTDPSELTNSLTSILGDLSALLPPESAKLLQTTLLVLNQTIELLNSSQIKELLDSEGGFDNVKDLIFDKVGDVVESIGPVLSDITEKILPAESLELLLAFVQAITDFEAAIPGDPDQIAGFIAHFFVNVPYDLLEQLRNLRRNLFDTMDSIIDTTSFEANKASVITGFTSARNLIDNLDVEDENSFQGVINALTSLQTDMATLQSAVTSLATSFQTGLAGLSLTDFSNQFNTLLDGLPEINVAGADDFTALLVAQIQNLNRLLDEADPTQLASAIRTVAERVETTLEGMGMAQLRETFLQFFRDIGELIDDLDIASLRQSVESVFTGIEEHVDALPLDGLQQTISSIFEQIGGFIDGIDLSAIRTAVEQLLQEIKRGLETLPLESFKELLLSIIEQVRGLIEEISSEFANVGPQIQTAIEDFGEIDFDPVVELVIEQIQEMKAQLQEIDVSALSPMLKSLLTTVVRFLKEMDFSGTISEPLMEQYDHLGPKVLLDIILENIQTLLNKLNDISPALLDTLTGQITESLQRYSPAGLMDPLISEFDEITQSISDQISPQKLMEPIQKAFDDVMNSLNQYSPGRLLSPVTEPLQQINDYIDKLDLVPVLKEIEDLQTGWFEDATSSLKQVTTGFKGSVSSSTEIADFVSTIDRAIDLINPQMFVDPLVTMNSLNTSLAAFKPSDLLRPLNRLFDRLITIVASISDDTLVNSINGVKQRLVDSIEELLPLNVMFAVPVKLEEVLDTINMTHNPRLSTEIQTPYVNVVNAFDSIVPDSISPALQPKYNEIRSLIAGLDPLSAFETHSATFANLKIRIAELSRTFDVENLSTAFGDVADKLESLVPDFLRQDSLTAESIRTALQALNLSSVINEADAAYAALLQKAQTLMPTLMPEIENLVNIIKENFLILTPAVFSTALNEVTEPLKEKLKALNPEQLIQALDEVYNRIVGKLSLLNPSFIAEQLDGVFSALESKLDQFKTQGLVPLKEGLKTIWDGVLEQLGILEVLRESLMKPFHQLMAAIKEIGFEDIFAALAAMIQQLRDTLEAALQRTETEFQAMVLAIPV